MSALFPKGYRVLRRIMLVMTAVVGLWWIGAAPAIAQTPAPPAAASPDPSPAGPGAPGEPVLVMPDQNPGTGAPGAGSPGPGPSGSGGAPDQPVERPPAGEPLAVVAYAKVDKPECVVGQHLNYDVELSYTTDGGRHVFLMPFDPPQADGLDVRDQKQNTATVLRSGRVIAAITNTVTYNCMKPGTFNLGPVKVPYDDGSGENLSTIAPAVEVTVRSTLLGRIRSSSWGKYVLFGGALLLFWIVVFTVRRVRRSRRARRESAGTEPSSVAAPAAIPAWDELDAQSKDPGPEFYEHLETRTWFDAFVPDPVPDASTATRLAELRLAGISDSALARLRAVIDACEKGRRPDSGLGMGDALETLRAAKSAADIIAKERINESETSDAATP